MRGKYVLVCAFALATLFGLASVSTGQSPDRDRDQAGQSAREMSPSDKVRENSHLRSKIEPLLPQGMDPVQAAEGYKDLEHFVASAHITKNLEIAFDQFKSRFLASTDNTLEKTVRMLKPALAEDKVAQEVARAETQARENIQAAEREHQASAGQQEEGQQKRPMAGRP